MKFRFIIIAAILALTGLTGFSQTALKDESTFKALIKQMTDAQTAYDAAALDKLLTSDYIEISPVGEFDPRDKVLGFYTPAAKAAAGNMTAALEATDFSTRTYDKFAIVIAKFTYSITADGRAMPPRSMRVMVVFRKEKDVWRIASAQYTGIRPPQPPKPA